MNLLPEYRGAEVYWLFHDNYLAAKILASTRPDLAEKIRKAIAAYGVTQSGKIEILFGEAPRPLPFRHFKLVEVARVGGKIVKTELAGETPLAGWENYADLCFFASLARAGTDRDAARGDFERGMKMWDGHGFADRVFTEQKIYSTYKLALAILAASRLNCLPQLPSELTKRLLSLQNADGGWVTDYTPSGQPTGLANVETTSLAIMALDCLRGNKDS